MPSKLKSCEIDLGTQMRLARASELARFGKLHESAELLTQRPFSEMLPEELDLLAHIYAKMGDYSEARSIWAQVSVIAPENPKYRECLFALRAAERHARCSMYAIASASMLLLMGTVFSFVLYRWSVTKASAPIVAKSAASPSSRQPTNTVPKNPSPPPATPRNR